MEVAIGNVALAKVEGWVRIRPSLTMRFKGGRHGIGHYFHLPQEIYAV